MADTTARAGVVLEPHLAPGEVVVAATQAQLDGGTMRLASRIGLAAGGGVGAALASDADDLEAKLANGVVLAVTSERVILLDVTAVSAKPRDPVLHLERHRITDVAMGETRVMLMKLPTIALTLEGDESRVLRFEIPKVARRDAEAVVDALSRRPTVPGGNP